MVRLSLGHLLCPFFSHLTKQDLLSIESADGAKLDIYARMLLNQFEPPMSIDDPEIEQVVQELHNELFWYPETGAGDHCANETLAMSKCKITPRDSLQEKVLQVIEEKALQAEATIYRAVATTEGRGAATTKKEQLEDMLTAIHISDNRKLDVTASLREEILKYQRILTQLTPRTSKNYTSRISLHPALDQNRNPVPSANSDTQSIYSNEDILIKTEKLEVVLEVPENDS